MKVYNRSYALYEHYGRTFMHFPIENQLLTTVCGECLMESK